MGRPLDIRNKQDREIAINALFEHDSRYLIEIDDIEDFNFSLDELKNYFPENYNFQIVAYGVKDNF